jgi:hypothetical protein
MGGTLWRCKNINPSQFFLEQGLISVMDSKAKETNNGMGCRVFPLFGTLLGIN